jgi:hypothetical protein
MSAYRTSLPPPLFRRTEVTTADLEHLDVVRRILFVLDEPAASASALATLVDEMPVLAARLGDRFLEGLRVKTTTQAELAYAGNRRLEAVLLELLEDLTALRAEQAGIPPSGSVFPPLATLRPPVSARDATNAALVVPRDEPIEDGAISDERRRSR